MINEQQFDHQKINKMSEPIIKTIACPMDSCSGEMIWHGKLDSIYFYYKCNKCGKEHLELRE